MDINITVKAVIQSYLSKIGADGLYNKCGNDECGCPKDDLFLCGYSGDDCVPAYLKGEMFFPLSEKGSEQTCKNCEIFCTAKTRADSTICDNYIPMTRRT